GLTQAKVEELRARFGKNEVEGECAPCACGHVAHSRTQPRPARRSGSSCSNRLVRCTLTRRRGGRHTVGRVVVFPPVSVVTRVCAAPSSRDRSDVTSDYVVARRWWWRQWWWWRRRRRRRRRMTAGDQ